VEKRGFTLVELMFVIAVIAILVALIVPHYKRYRERSIMTACGQNMKQISLAIQMYENDLPQAIQTQKIDDLKNSDIGKAIIEKKYLRRWPQCKSGGKYGLNVLNNNREVFCSIHGTISTLHISAPK